MFNDAINNTDNMIVVLSDSFITANYDLTATEYKIIMAAMTYLSHRMDNSMDFSFTTDQICEICNLPKNHINRTLSTACKNLLKKSFTIRETGDRKYSWIKDFSFNGNQWVITLSDDLKPFFLRLILV